MSRIIVLVCLVGLTVLACGPATPEPVTEGEPGARGGEPAAGGSQAGMGAEMVITPALDDPGPSGEPVTPGLPDQDFDGIPDASDRCVDTPEDRDGFQDEDGCPDPDNDQDGLSDIQDMCPAEPEDMDGTQDEDGCPDP